MRAIRKITKNQQIREGCEKRHEIQSFFGLLTGTLHLENRISRLFQGCFLHSSSFKKAFLSLLLEKKIVNNKMLHQYNWDCIYQPQTPNSTRLKPDLLLSTVTSNGNNLDIYIESKIHATLTDKQLRNYKQNGVQHLIVLTKFIPDIPLSIMGKLEVNALRWQDIHATLVEQKHESQHDRFICNHFVKFLEEAAMAHNQELSLTDYNEIGSLFRTFAKSSKNGIGRFDYRIDCMSRCSSLLEEIRIELENHNPKLKTVRKWSGYYNVTDVDGNISYHVLQYSLYKTSYNRHRFCWSFWFPQDSETSISWYIFYYKNGEEINKKDYLIEEIAKKKGGINSILLKKSVISYANKWKVAL
jgi:hypothetical protein